MNIQAQNVKVGSAIIKNDKKYKITDKRFHGYPRDEDNKATTVSLTLDGHWSLAFPVDQIIDILA